MPNPIFGHATYDNGWTTGANLVSSENKDPRFVLFGKSSAKLTAISTGTNTFTISVTAANINTHAFSVFAKLPDGGVVSTTQIQLRYAGSDLVETYTHIGDGWYRVTATAAGVASAQNLVLSIAAGYTVYVDGVQMEESPYATPLMHGDLVGCSWAGDCSRQ